MKIISKFTAICFLVLTVFICPAQNALPGLEKFHRVVFIGDSITYAGSYIDDIEAYVLTRDTNSTITVLNLGQSSETVSGRSEPGHAGRSFHVNVKDHHYLDPDRFLTEAGRKEGSWWPEWASWLSLRSGPATVLQAMGAPHAGYAPLDDAPGVYVLRQ